MKCNVFSELSTVRKCVYKTKTTVIVHSFISFKDFREKFYYICGSHLKYAQINSFAFCFENKLSAIVFSVLWLCCWPRCCTEPLAVAIVASVIRQSKTRWWWASNVISVCPDHCVTPGSTITVANLIIKCFFVSWVLQTFKFPLQYGHPSGSSCYIPLCVVPCLCYLALEQLKKRLSQTWSNQISWSLIEKHSGSEKHNCTSVYSALGAPEDAVTMRKSFIFPRLLSSPVLWLFPKISDEYWSKPCCMTTRFM